jgi:hypothetical protein
MTDEEPGVEEPTQTTTPVRVGLKWGVAKERVQAAIRRYARHPTKDAGEDVAEPPPVPTPAVSPVQRIRAELAEAGIAARRMLPRVRLAWLVIVAVAQVVIAFVGWRIWVWRGRPRLK